MKYKISKRQRIKADREYNRAKERLKSWQTANGITETITIRKLKLMEAE